MYGFLKFVNMNLNFYRFYLGFLLFYISLIVNTSSGNLQSRSTQDPGELKVCRRSCHGINTTTSCGKHGVNETRSGRCCVNDGLVVG